MPAIIVVGAQWGDEGKGRVVDDLAREAHLVARYNGGDNAGHTVVAQGHVLRLHLVPSGILHPHATCLIGAGVVVNPVQLAAELDQLAALGVDVGPERVKLAAAAHIILPTHRALDGAREAARGREAIGTTRRGIGPVYADKAAARACVPVRWPTRRNSVSGWRLWYGSTTACSRSTTAWKPLPVGEIVAESVALAQRLRPHLTDGSELVAARWRPGRSSSAKGPRGPAGPGPRHVPVCDQFLLRGGRGTDRAGLRAAGGGTGDRRRQGLHDPRGRRALPHRTDRRRWRPHPGGRRGIRHHHGPPRRCGWLDLPILRYAAQVNGLTELALTKLDVLTGIHPLRVAVAYERDGERIARFPGEWGAEEVARWRRCMRNSLAGMRRFVRPAAGRTCQWRRGPTWNG